MTGHHHQQPTITATAKAPSSGPVLAEAPYSHRDDMHHAEPFWSMLDHIRRWCVRHYWELIATLVILGAIGIRITLVAAGWPGTDSDDATMGLMAKHILNWGEHPIFFYGQAYMGSIEAYLGALFFVPFGSSEFALKCGLILLYAGFLVVMYCFLVQIASRPWALIGLILLSLGGDEMLYHQLEAYGGYLETIFFGAIMLTLACWLMRGSDTSPTSPTCRRRWAFAGWGLAAGLGIWSDPLVAPFVALSAGALIVFCWSELRRWCGIIALSCCLLGVSPWIVYVATAQSLDAARSFVQQTPQAPKTPKVPRPSSSAPSPMIQPGDSLIDRVLGMALISLPNETGATALCPLTIEQAWPPSHWTTPPVRECIGLRGVWGGGLLALLALALIAEARMLLQLRRSDGPWWRRDVTRWSPQRRDEAARSMGRFLAMAAPACTIVLYSCSSVAGSDPWIYSRYLISLAIALPVILASLWIHSSRWRHSVRKFPSRQFWNSASQWRGRLAPWSIGCIVVVLVVVLTLGTIGTYQEVPAQQARNRVQADLVARLIQTGETQVYTGFWTCYRMMFQSDERVICSVLNGDMTLRPSRYALYDDVVQVTAHPAYVFPLPSAEAETFPKIAAQRGWRIDTTSIVDQQYIIFAVTQPPPRPQPITANGTGYEIHADSP